MADKFEKALNTLLEGDYAINTLTPGMSYSRRQDDTDGERTFEHDLKVIIGNDNDAHVFPIYHPEKLLHSLRFRNYYGGGQSLRTRKALLILAEAMRRDNEEFPQN
jgi:hypothetical protein